jgi:TRAP-type mannitol/chloroaromatic compound transport system permease large subunit
LGALISGAVYGRLNWTNLKYGLTRTAQVTAMVMWIMTAGAGFASTFSAMGGQQFVTAAIGGLELHPWLIIIMMQLIYVAMGCFLDANAIMMLSIPVFIPIVESLGFSTLWFGVLFMVNMELAFLTPPFGINLFYMKGVVPTEISMGDIYSAALPFLILQAVGLAICMIFPQTILYLAGMVG